MAKPKRASLYLERGVWFVSFWNGNHRIRKSTKTCNRKLAEEVRKQFEREMILGTVDIQKKLDEALHDPARREAILAAIEP